MPRRSSVATSSSALRCSAWPPRYRRRHCRSCPARRSAGSGSRSPAPVAPGHRRSRRRRADGTCPSRRRRCARTSCKPWPGSSLSTRHAWQHDAPMHRLQPVAHVGQRTAHDRRQRIGEVSLLQRRLESIGSISPPFGGVVSTGLPMASGHIAKPQTGTRGETNRDRHRSGPGSPFPRR